MSVMTRVDPALADVDPEIAALIGAEQERQSAKIRLIPSENYVSKAVLEATGRSSRTSTRRAIPDAGLRGPAGHRPGRDDRHRAREVVVRRRARQRPAVLRISRQPRCVLRVRAAGRHDHGDGAPDGRAPTHGAPPTLSGKWLHPVQSGVRKDTGRVDMDQVADLARRDRPKIIVCGERRYREPSTSRRSHRSRATLVRSLLPTSRTSPDSSPAACTRRRSDTLLSSRRRHTRRCAGRGAR